MSNEFDKEAQDKLFLEFYKAKEAEKIRNQHYDDWLLDFINHYDINCKCPRCYVVKRLWR